MNLADEIEAAAKCAPTRKKRLPNSWQRATEIARLKHTANAIERYRTVMRGAGWLTQSEIECKLGYATTVARDFLNKLWLEHNLIERRNKNNAGLYIRKQGYQWRWKDGA